MKGDLDHGRKDNHVCNFEGIMASGICPRRIADLGSRGQEYYCGL